MKKILLLLALVAGCQTQPVTKTIAPPMPPRPKLQSPKATTMRRTVSRIAAVPEAWTLQSWMDLIAGTDGEDFEITPDGGLLIGWKVQAHYKFIMIAGALNPEVLPASGKFFVLTPGQAKLFMDIDTEMRRTNNIALRSVN